MEENKETLYSYLAGLVDGEGSICVKSESKSRPYVIYLEMANCNYKLISIFEENFGGKVRKRDNSKNKKNLLNNWKPCYEWQLSKKKAATVIKKIFPYLIAKKRQAVLVLRMDKFSFKNGQIKKIN